MLCLYIESRQQPKVIVEERSVYEVNPSEAISSPVAPKQLLHAELTAANYKSRLRMLMYHEMKEIERKLTTDVGQ